MRVAEAEFVNCKEAVVDIVSEGSFMYKNDVKWINSTTIPYSDYPFPQTMDPFDRKYGFMSAWAYGTKVFENTIYNDDANASFVGISTDQVAWFGTYGGMNVKGNSVENDPTASLLGTAQVTNGDNSFLQIGCNNYKNLELDWEINGTLTTQGDGNFGNNNVWTGNNVTGDIISSTSSSWIYFCQIPSLTEPFVTGSVQTLPAAEMSCTDLNPCTEVYGDDAMLMYNGEQESWEILALTLAPPIQLLDEALVHGDGVLARTLLTTLQLTDYETRYYEGIATYYDVVLSALEADRKFAYNASEIDQLKELVNQGSYVGYKAQNALLFYAGIRYNPPMPQHAANQLNEFVDISIEYKINSNSSIFTLYPNPAGSSFTLRFTYSNSIRVVLYNTMGQMVLEVKEVSAHQPINITHLHSGLYTVQILDGEKILSTQKLIK
jgi:hypothetical protein